MCRVRYQIEIAAQKSDKKLIFNDIIIIQTPKFIQLKLFIMDNIASPDPHDKTPRIHYPSSLAHQKQSDRSASIRTPTTALHYDNWTRRHVRARSESSTRFHLFAVILSRKSHGNWPRVNRERERGRKAAGIKMKRWMCEWVYKRIYRKEKGY